MSGVRPVDVQSDPVRYPSNARTQVRNNAPADGFWGLDAGDNLAAVWSGKTGSMLPGSPFLLEDFTFFNSQAIADITGDDYPEIITGSGGYYLHAWTGDGAEGDRALLRALLQDLDRGRPIELAGDRATMTYGLTQHVARLVREDGLWKVEDLD